MAAFGEFSFEMTDAIIEQVSEYIDKLSWSPLDSASVDAEIPSTSRSALGVYVLGRKLASGEELKAEEKGRLVKTSGSEKILVVYVGQSQSAIYDRLKRHADFILDRCGLPPGSIVFKAAEIIIFNAVSVESRLIQLFRTKWKQGDPYSGWNGSGFGSNDSGGGRDGQKPSQLDRLWPIDVLISKQSPFNGEKPGSDFQGTIKDAISALSKSVPYPVRVDNGNSSKENRVPSGEKHRSRC